MCLLPLRGCGRKFSDTRVAGIFFVIPYLAAAIIGVADTTLRRGRGGSRVRAPFCLGTASHDFLPGAQFFFAGEWRAG